MNSVRCWDAKARAARYRHPLMLAACTWLVLCLVSSTGAQEPGKKNSPKNKSNQQEKDQDKKEGVPGPQVEGDPAAEGSGSLLNMIIGSGPTGLLFMGVLGLFSIVGASVAVERAFNLRRNRILPQEYVDEINRCSAQAQPDLARIQELSAESQSPVAVIVMAGVERQGASLTELEKAMEDAAARELAELRARMRPLTTVGAVAPLVGLLGTVVGMIIAFHTASQAGLGKAELLAKGIYMALITTAGGLAVAIPAMLLAAYFTGRVERMFREMDRLLSPLVNALGKLSGVARPVESTQVTAKTVTKQPRSPQTQPAPAKKVETNRPNPLQSPPAEEPRSVPEVASKNEQVDTPAALQPTDSQPDPEPVAAESTATGRRPPKRKGSNPIQF